MAQSKNGNRFFLLISSAILAHCSFVGSTPVGLWAQAWRMITECMGAPSRSSIIPSQSSPFRDSSHLLLLDSLLQERLPHLQSNGLPHSLLCHAPHDEHLSCQPCRDVLHLCRPQCRSLQRCISEAG